MNAHNIARKGDIAGFYALAHFLLLTTLSKVNWTKKTCCFSCHFFFLFLPGWTSDALKALNTMISRSIPRNNLSCPVTHPFPREAAASDAAGEQGLPGWLFQRYKPEWRQERWKAAEKQLKEMGGGNVPTTKLISELIKAWMVWGLWSNKRVEICQWLKKKSN